MAEPSGRSSNGKTADSGSAYRGSNPCLPALTFLSFFILYSWLPSPSPREEARILKARCPEASDNLLRKMVRLINAIPATANSFSNIQKWQKSSLVACIPSTNGERHDESNENIGWSEFWRSTDMRRKSFAPMQPFQSNWWLCGNYCRRITGSGFQLIHLPPRHFSLIVVNFKQSRRFAGSQRYSEAV